jgi:hypothetical protein
VLAHAPGQYQYTRSFTARLYACQSCLFSAALLLRSECTQASCKVHIAQYTCGLPTWR